MDIKKLNDNSEYLEWNELQYDNWEMFDEPKDLTSSEILLARQFLEMMKIDADQQQLINFKAAPVHFANLIVHFKRRLEVESPEISAENFSDSIEDDI